MLLFIVFIIWYCLWMYIRGLIFKYEKFDLLAAIITSVPYSLFVFLVNLSSIAMLIMGVLIFCISAWVYDTIVLEDKNESQI